MNIILILNGKNKKFTKMKKIFKKSIFHLNLKNEKNLNNKKKLF